MSKNPPKLLPEREEELRTAMALNRGMEWLEELSKPPSPSKDEEYASLRMGSMEKLLYDTHHHLFQDWNGNNDPVSGENRARIREAIESVFFAKDGKGLFDENGFALRAEGSNEQARQQFAEKLATFYEKITELQPFSYGNKLTLDFFVVAISKLPVVAEVYPEGVDMRRMDGEDLKAIAQKHPDHAALVKAFMHATDPAIVHPLMNHHKIQGKDGYRLWDDKTEYVGGVPFLSHSEKDENGHEQKYLVLMNGGLVKLDTELKAKLDTHFKSNDLISNFPPLKVEKYLTSSDTELQKKLNDLKTSKEISGVKITAEGEAPLVCLDVNIMTGLRPTSQSQLMEFLQSNKNHIRPDAIDKSGNINLAVAFSEFKAKDPKRPDEPPVRIDKDEALQPLLERTNDERMKAMLNIAYDRVSANNRHMEKVITTMFKDKTTGNQTPKMFMSMGGSGSGKSIMEKIVKSECPGNDYVISALDSFRVHNDINTLLVAAGHHRDDYSVIDPYATALRAQVIDKAIADRVNILCDGSGINYKGRNDKTVARFKESGFETNLVAIEASYPNAVSRVNARFDAESRAMPWIRAADKHVNFPPSLLDAVRDKNLDKLSLIASDRAKGEEYLIAETIDMSHEKAEGWKEQKKSGLVGTLTRLLGSAVSITKSFAGINPNEVKDIKNIPGFTNANASFISYPNVGRDGKDRILAVYNVSRLAGGIEKGLMNPYANSPDAEVLYHTKRDLPFYTPDPKEHAQGAWQVKMRSEAAKPNKGIS